MSSTNSKLTRVADNVRILSAAMVEKAKSGHPGGAMGGADFITVLFAEFLRYDPDNMAYPHRDRFFLDPGHMSPMLYATLSLAGHYTTEDLQSLRQWGSVTPGHPEVDVLRGVENTSGPLGQGHAMALGAAIAERFLAARFGEWTAHRTYAYISDGSVEEEISQGVGRIAGHLGLSNFVMYYDANNVQLSTKVDEVDTENVAMKYEAWGWNVLSIDGNNINAIREALVAAESETERPTLIIGRTVMGKGARGPAGESFEDKVSTHGQPLTAAGADIGATIRNLGGDPEHPFAVFDESREVFAERREALRAWAAQQAAVEKSWRAEHKELARRMDRFFSGELPEIDYKTIEVKPDVATRAASAAVLGVYAEKVGNMIVSSADLSNSDKTDGFLKKTRAFVKGDFSGQFFQAGVSELTMACVMNGMALKIAGESYNTEDVAAIEAAGAKLLELAPNIRLIKDDNLQDDLISGEISAGVMYTSQVTMACLANPDLKVVYPSEGIGFGIMAQFVPVNAPNPDAAHAFIDYILRPEVSKQCFEYIGYYCTNQAADALIEDAYQSFLTLPEDFSADNMEMIQNISAEAMEAHTKVWTEFRTACGQ